MAALLLIKSWFPVQRVAEIVASQAAANLLLFFGMRIILFFLQK